MTRVNHLYFKKTKQKTAEAEGVVDQGQLRLIRALKPLRFMKIARITLLFLDFIFYKTPFDQLSEAAGLYENCVHRVGFCVGVFFFPCKNTRK